MKSSWNPISVPYWCAIESPVFPGMHHNFFRKDLKNRGPVTSLVGPARWRYLEQPDLELQPQEALVKRVKLGRLSGWMDINGVCLCWLNVGYLCWLNVGFPLAARGLFQPFVGCEDWKVTSLCLGGYFRPVHLQLRRQKADVFAVIEDAAFAHYNSAAWIWRTLSSPFEVPCLSARWWFFSNLAGKDLPSTYEPCIGWCRNSICNCDFWAWFQLRSHRGCRWTSAYEFCAADCGSTGLLSRLLCAACAEQDRLAEVRKERKRA